MLLLSSLYNVLLLHSLQRERLRPIVVESDLGGEEAGCEEDQSVVVSSGDE